ncbi:PF08006 family protein [Staphylococcus epidermidis VCU118]|nr:PF08006 family protein [Staphylococcus epidermidis VCU118]
MDKITFLNELELALDDLPREEKDSIMHKYENLFYEEELKGISESQIIKKLNDPYHISKEVKARSAIHYASYKPTLANIVRAILASLSLGILSLFIILYRLLSLHYLFYSVSLFLFVLSLHHLFYYFIQYYMVSKML